MTRIEKIRQMTDEELAEFLSKVDLADRLQTCPERSCPERSCPDRAAVAGFVDPCAVCMLCWLRREGPLMDGEG